MDATKIRLADIPPPGCAACFGQYPDRRHVDFGAVYDGPVLNTPEVMTTGANNVQVDDLIICEECLSAAAACIGLADSAKMVALMEELTAHNSELAERLSGAMAALDARDKADAKRESLLTQMKGSK